ncbi:MAG: NAD(P)(+) transhydrogenase (Re/Si-specific) subunit beta [Nocardioidaceae bacterium]
MIPTWVQLAYLAAAVCFILALKGLSSPRTARRGNQLGAAAAVVATVVVFFEANLDHLWLIIAAIAVGTVLGVVGAQRVQMTQMPQLVALFNGVGGGAAALVALIELEELTPFADVVPTFTFVATVFTIFVGAVSFSGSMVTFAKLQELITTRPVIFPVCRSRSAAPSSPRSRSRSSRSSRRSCGPASCWRCSVSWSAPCWCCPSAAPTSRSSSPCSTPSPA